MVCLAIIFTHVHYFYTHLQIQEIRFFTFTFPNRFVFCPKGHLMMTSRVEPVHPYYCRQPSHLLMRWGPHRLMAGTSGTMLVIKILRCKKIKKIEWRTDRGPADIWSAPRSVGPQSVQDRPKWADQPIFWQKIGRRKKKGRSGPLKIHL